MKKRIQITINPDLLREAERLVQLRKFDNFSGFVEALLREEWERKGSPKATDVELPTSPENTSILNTGEKTVSPGRALARAFPPFNPPSLPNATAAGFFSGGGGTGACPVDCWTMLKAVSFKSLLERLGIKQKCAQKGKIQAQSEILGFKTYHYPYFKYFLWST